jgi:hypothetical protein
MFHAGIDQPETDKLEIEAFEATQHEVKADRTNRSGK